MQAMFFNISFQFFISAIALLEVTNNKPVSHMSMFFVLRCYLYSFAYGDKPFFFLGLKNHAMSLFSVKAKRVFLPSRMNFLYDHNQITS